MSFQVFLPHVRSVALLLAVAVHAWYCSRQARAALGDVEGMSYREVMQEHLGRTMKIFGLRELVVSPIAEVLLFFLPLMLAFSTLSEVAILACVIVAAAHTFAEAFRLNYCLLFRDIPASWHKEVKHSQPLAPFEAARTYGLSSLVTAVVAVLGQSVLLTLGAYIVTRYAANRFLDYERRRQREA